jgi:uncharacterized protein YgiM (DUF1202 family)
MSSTHCRGLATAACAALALLMVLGREASAERLYTERPAELRSSPGDDSQVVRRVGKGKSLEVVKRLGTWVMVEYEGRTGWIRRTALSTEPVSGGSAGADDDKKDRKKADKADRKKDAGADEDPDVEAKAAAAGARRTAARKKAERRKSRKARRAADRDNRSARKAADDDEEEVADDRPRRPRSTWGARGRLPGGPLKVEIQAISVQAFSEPDGSGKVVFTAAEGDRVRVIARGENRWLLIENGKKRTGWIPAFAVRDNGLIPEARKDVSRSGDEEPEADESAADEEEEVSETRPRKSAKARKTRTASARDTGSSDDEIEDSDDGEDEGGRSSRDESEASLEASSDGELGSRRKELTGSGSLRAGFTAVGMDVSPDGQAAQAASYSGPTATLTGELAYRLKPRISILGELTYDWSTALGGLSVTPEGGQELDGGSAMNHRIGVSAGVGYGKRMTTSLRLGYQYAIFQVSDLDNVASWPRESTSGPTAGLGFAVPDLAGKLGLKLGVDALLFGSRGQTEGSREGAELDSLLGLSGSARVDYPIGKNLLVDGGYRFGYTTASWTGASERTGAMATDRTDQAHELSIGVGWRL